MYGNVCTASNWWVTTAIDVIFVMAIIGVALWIIKQALGTRNNLGKTQTDPVQQQRQMNAVMRTCLRDI